MMHISLRLFRSSFSIRILVAALSLAALPGLRAQTPAFMSGCGDLVCEMQKDWQRNTFLLGLMADAMPEDKFGFKPTPAQQTFAERVLHAATVNVLLIEGLGGKTSAPKLNDKVTKKVEVIAELRRATEYGDAALKELDEAGLLARIASPPIMVSFMGKEQSRVRILSFAMAHMQNVYGQLAVYLRLNGVTPPLSREP